MLGHISGTFVWVTETDVVIGVPPRDLISHLKLRKSVHLSENGQAENQIETTRFSPLLTLSFSLSLTNTHTDRERATI